MTIGIGKIFASYRYYRYTIFWDLILGGKVSDLPIIDGVDLWSSLSNDQDSPRSLMLHNIDESRNIAALRVGDWKMVKGKMFRISDVSFKSYMHEKYISYYNEHL